MITIPVDEYKLRLSNQQKKIQKLSRTDKLLSTLRGLLFLIFIFLFFYILNSKTSYLWLAVPAITFAVVIVWHEQIIERKQLALRIASFYELGLARLENRWMGLGTKGNEFKDASHPFSEDLDLFGAGSLFELFCIARTKTGEETLAKWLLNPAEPVEIRQRQEAVEDLRNRLDFRVDIATQGMDIRNRVRPESLMEWARKPAVSFGKILRYATTLSVLLTLLTLYGWAQLGWGWNPFVFVVIVQIFLMRHLGNRVQHITHGAEGAHQELKVLALILRRIEQENFQSLYLQQMKQQMQSEGIMPSQQIRRMGALLELLDWQRNQLFAPVAILFLWEAHLAFALESWRQKYGRKIPLWIHEVGKIESLNSFSAFAYENPNDIFPEIVENVACYEGKQLGHPLIPEKLSVRNSVELNTQHSLKIVSGSNMSGKSTFLRTIGVNAVLALSGAPVRAEHLRLSKLSIGASIHILDSLQSGSSRFYAEITRIRQLMDLAQSKPPLLFLLDEILHGTNSADRLIGAEAIVRGFLKYGGIGLMTTHDLALTNIATKLGPVASNIHFQDHIENGRIAFDYKVHPGIVEKSNAIELMRAVGLEI